MKHSLVSGLTLSLTLMLCSCNSEPETLVNEVREFFRKVR